MNKSSSFFACRAVLNHIAYKLGESISHTAWIARALLYTVLAYYFLVWKRDAPECPLLIPDLL